MRAATATVLLKILWRRRLARQNNGLAIAFGPTAFRGMPDLPPLPAKPSPGHYRHYKGNHYRVIGLARHSETLEPLVVYQALYGEMGLWVRPAAMFTESIEFNGRRVPRFDRIGDFEGVSSK